MYGFRREGRLTLTLSEFAVIFCISNAHGGDIGNSGGGETTCFLITNEVRTTTNDLKRNATGQEECIL